MLEKLKNWRDALIEDCRHWWRLWSSWLAILWGIVVTAFWNDPTFFKDLVDQMPEEVRGWLSPLVLAFVSGLPIFIRLLKQQKLIDAVKEGKTHHS